MFELKQGIRAFSLRLGELSRKAEDKSKFFGMLQKFGYKGDISNQWKVYCDMTTKHKSKKKKS